MSAFVVGKAHIDLLVDVACRGPRGVAVSPDTVWYGTRWFANGAAVHDESSYVKNLRELKQSSSRDDMTRVGRMLTGECVRSVCYRYASGPHEDIPGPVDHYWHGTDADDKAAIRAGDEPNPFCDGYTFEQRPYRMTVGEALSAIDCYEYQSCEHPDWEGSEAKRFCTALREALCHRVPGYDSAPWGWDDDTVDRALATR